MSEILLVPDPHRPFPTPMTAAGLRLAAEQRWPSATFPENPPSVLTTVWVEDHDLRIDLHPNGATLTVDHADEVSTIAQWWANALGADVWITDVSGVGYTAITAGG